jgi:uncharacterized protein
MSATERLHAVLDTAPRWTIAVSGGVDSLTLASVAHRYLSEPPLVVHATSPAVPEMAGQRVRAEARRQGWRLKVVEAGEMQDEDYLSNPQNRCYFCKNRLYLAIGAVLAQDAGSAVASGTNLDDLDDVRPGLGAARERGVRHPFVEARIDKATVRELAREGGHDFAELPAQPCLASRIETGLRIAPEDLAFVDALEERLRLLTPPGTDLRVRIRSGGVAVESACGDPELQRLAAESCRDAGRVFLGLESYRRGSAFLRAER